MYFRKFIQRGFEYGKQTFLLELDSVYSIEFPEKKDININMMPFIMSQKFKDSKLPKYTFGYWRFITKCIECDKTQVNKIGYLTINESEVKAGETQRRSGLHCESHGLMNVSGNATRF